MPKQTNPRALFMAEKKRTTAARSKRRKEALKSGRPLLPDKPPQKFMRQYGDAYRTDNNDTRAIS
jgi:hypothetical protein